MPEKTLWPPTRQVRGFTPALDRRQLPTPSVVEGKNFLIDAEGPYSAFGIRLSTYAQLVNPSLAYSFRVGGELFYFVDEGVLQYDTLQKAFYPVLVFAMPSSEIFPWTHAVVGGKHYFAKKGHDLIEYDPFAVSWNEITANVPTGPCAVTSYADRLIILCQTAVARSAISDGADLATSTVTGAGFVALALIGNGEPLGIKRIPTGFLAFTTEGIMLGTAIQAISPFRYTALDHDYKPIDPFMIVEVEQDIVFLSKQGFYQTRGQFPVPFEEVMSEYFRRQILNRIDLSKIGIIRLHYNQEHQWFIVSLTAAETPFIYNEAYVLYLPIKQWGIFSKEHSNFIEVLLTDGIDEGYNFGYLDRNGFFHKFTEDPFSELTPDINRFYLYFSEILPTVSRIENGLTVFSSGMVIYDIDLRRITQGPGLYVEPTSFDLLTRYFEISLSLSESSTYEPLSPGFLGIARIAEDGRIRITEDGRIRITES